MELIKAIILGIIQGLTEFLPISSSGHLVLAQKIMGFTEPPMIFDTVLHLGTLFAVVLVLWGDIWPLLKKPFQKMTALLIFGTIPTVLIGLLLKDFFDNLFKSGKTLGVEFIFTGLILFAAQRMSNGHKKLKETSGIDALFVGVMQGIAILPAVSRSGLTIAGSLFRKMDREFAARFSFLLSIPAILGATVLQLKDIVGSGEVMPATGNLVGGFLFSFIFGVLSVKFMMKVIKEGKLNGFGIYCTALGGLILLDQLVLHIFF